jgi:hypothetical protein
MTTTSTIVVLALGLQAGAGPKETSCDSSLQAWLACNNPRVIGYLLKLSAEHVGTVLPGVELSDGTKALKSHRFLGKAKGLPKGVQVYLFAHEGSPLAYAWVDEGGVPLTLPECEGVFPGSAYVLSGDVYTWKALQPGHGVVEVSCVDPEWTVQPTK